ncbi:MAG: ChuX/HutX family heme-like substrate-binding protein [Gemmataceae bacterium]
MDDQTTQPMTDLPSGSAVVTPSRFTLADRVRAALKDNPRAMTMQLAKDLEVPEVEIMRVWPDNRAVELDIERWEELIRSLELCGKVHVIVSNGATTIEAVGQFGGFSTWDEFFNVQTKSLDMHIRYRNLGAAFAVEKPSHMSGMNTLSIQFYDVQGNSAFKVFLTFGESAPSSKLIEHFSQIRNDFRKRPDAKS